MLHDEGKSLSVFDRLDYSPSAKDTFHLNLLLGRNRFQIPNTYEQETLGQDQRQLVRSLNIAPGYVHIFSPSTVLTVNPYYRLDQVWFYPSADPFSDQTTTIRDRGIAEEQRRFADELRAAAEKLRKAAEDASVAAAEIRRAAEDARKYLDSAQQRIAIEKPGD